MSLGKRFLHGAGMSLMEHAVKMAAMFITTPLMNHSLGTEHYGYWLLVMSALGWFGLLDLGVSFTTSRFLSVAVGAGDVGRQAVVMQVATKHFQRMSWITALGSVVVFVALPLWFAPPGSLTTTMLLLATVPAGLSLALRFWFRIPQLRLRAWVRYDRLALAAIIRTLLQSTALIVLLPGYQTLLVVGFAQAIGDVIELSLQGLFAKALPRVAPSAAQSDEAKTVQREMLSYARDMLLGIVGDGMRTNVGPFAVGRIGSVVQVPVYSVGIRLIGMMEDVVNALFGGGVLAVFGQLGGASNPERLRIEFARISRITAGFGGWAVTGMVLFAPAFINRWMREGFEESHVIVFILALPNALRLMQYAANSLLYALGHQREVMWMRCIGGVVAALLAIGLGMMWGVRGVAAGCSIEMGLNYAIIMPWLVSRATQIDGVVYLFRDVLWPGIKGALPSAVAAYFFRDWIQPDYVALIKCFAVYGGVFAMLTPWTLLDGEGRALLKRAILHRGVDACNHHGK